ncbi:hypothetical protein DCC77_00840 [Candidatus Uhrbacteria bacterium]|nr:MAG: hypothetical protein DCC77_00840 [Candidatus Uhrbacteria bacterium]
MGWRPERKAGVHTQLHNNTRREYMTTAPKPPELLAPEDDDEDEPRLCSLREKVVPAKTEKLRLVENKVSTSLGDHPVLIRLRRQMAEKEKP